MRRHPRLVPLSREHHVPLRLGRHLVGGGGRSELAQMLPALAAHFRAEEHELMSLLESRSGQALAHRLRAEHEALEALLEAALRGERQAEAGQALIDHVRFEERVLFPRVETFFEEALP